MVPAVEHHNEGTVSTIEFPTIAIPLFFYSKES